MIEEGMPTDEEESSFYEALGRAITEWANLEDLLFQITHGLLACTKARVAIVFYRTPTIDSRISLTGDLIANFLPTYAAGEQPDPRLRQWRDLANLIKQHLPTRNHLAHHPVEPILDFAPPEADGTEWVSIKYGSRTSSSELLRKRQDEPDIHTIDEIRAHRRVVLQMVNSLRNFQRMYLPMPPPEPIQQESKQIQDQDSTPPA